MMTEPGIHDSQHAKAQACGHALTSVFHFCHMHSHAHLALAKSHLQKTSSKATHRQLQGRTARPPRWRGSSAACSRLLPSP